MSELISGKEAKLAWANGKQLKYITPQGWLEVDEKSPLWIFDSYNFKVIECTIKINGMEVPAPFKPKIGDFYYCVSPFDAHGYTKYRKEDNYGYGYDQFGAWRTEEEIKQVVAVLRSVFNEK